MARQAALEETVAAVVLAVLEAVAPLLASMAQAETVVPAAQVVMALTARMVPML
jgi:hypothetical protein